MNETKRLSVTMTRGERVLGWLYVPFFLVLLAWILEKASGFWAGTPGPYWVRLG